MSRLTIYSDDTPTAVLRTEDAAEISAELDHVGVRFERWQSPVELSPADDAQVILAAYRPYLDRLMAEKGARSADVLKQTADHPAAAAMRQKFLPEHMHTEDEMRFFVHGSAHFMIHVNGRVFDMLCGEGDLIGIPAGVNHWFDPGERPFYTVLRVSSDIAGWVPHYTGDTISLRFPAG